MAHYEKTIDSRVIYEGRILSLRRDMVELENGLDRGARGGRPLGRRGGARARRERQHPLCVTVPLPVWGRAARAARRQAGEGENPAECGMRELGEECGCAADLFQPLAKMYPTCAYDTEIIHIFYATGCVPPAAPRRGRVFDRPPHPGGKSGADGARRGNPRRENPASAF